MRRRLWKYSVLTRRNAVARRATAATELALLLPLIGMFVFALADFGLAIRPTA